MILTLTIGSAIAPLGLAACQSLVASVARAGIDGVFFVRSGGVMLDALPLIAALATVPASIGLGASVPTGYSEPFHLARSFAAIDRLTAGRSALIVDAADDLSPALSRSLPENPARVQEFFDATTSLWDSWEDDALLVDRPSGLFTNPDKIHRIDHDGAYYTVRGPLNAPRPLQGWPVIVARPGPAASFADVLLLPEPPAARYGRAKILVDIVEPRQMQASGLCDGFNIVPADLSELPSILDAVARLDRPLPPLGTTLRQRLGLPRPLSRYAA